MDKNTNPFNPGAGVSPPELAGRSEVLETAETALARTKRGKHAKSLMILGLRGVGKTVLLNQIKDRALALGYLAEMQEAHDGAELKQLLIPVLRRVLLRLDRVQNTVETVKRGIRILRSFIGNITIAAGGAEVTLGGDSEAGYADSGNLEDDLRDVLIATAEAARDAGKPVAILIDELQYLSKDELGALIRGIHAVNQAALPLILFGAGLPQLAGQAGDAKSYAERLFEFPRLGALLETDAWKALRDPVEEEGASISDDALREIFEKTHGYPYFLQEWGYTAWNIAKAPTITEADAQAATEESIRKLDESFFRVRFDRTTPAERDYMRCLAELGEGPQRSADVAKALGRNATSLGPVRDSLIKKGMIYSPEYALIAFTVPLFDEFMRRVTASPLT
ncbi:AAA family ATPase [Pseudomonas sp. CFBP13508]|uniref:AAA family ATPase n=1 Tax=unclassified Pseudomonas TaxID=196821 RepID=UPI001032A3A0|nr:MULTISPECIES: ATP-binding protein [unclassified Pseudomonas]MBR7199286.1 ATP-binding protein [Pseudomonas sp. 14A]TKJ73974.1 AAA family ATPase [Pseudomonas sp. CFBP13508]